jgi:nitroreductase
MDAIELFLKRRSVRKFNADPVPEDLIQQLLRAAMAAPSAVNNRPWEFVVVNEPSALQSLKRQLPLGQYNAPLAVVVIGNPRNSFGERFWIQDCSAAMENLLLAAVNLGLGGVWIGIHPIATLVKRVRSELGIPEQAIPLGIALIGYPAERKKPRDQYDAKRIHWQHY